MNILKRPRSDWTVAGAAERTKQTMMKILLFVVKWFKMLERERKESRYFRKQEGREKEEE